MGPNKSLTVLTSLVLCACYILTATLFLGLKNFNHFLLAWGQDLQMTVYLKDGALPTEVAQLIAQIKKDALVHEVREVSPEENLNHFKSQMGERLPDLQNDREMKAMIPSTLEIIFDFKSALSEPLEVFAKMADGLRGQATVEQVSYGQMWVEKFARIFAFIRQAFWLVSVLIIVASVFVFSNAVRAWIHARRAEIEVLELVGATPWIIRKPYLYRGIVLGFSTGTVAVGLISVMILNLKDFLAQNEMMRGLGAGLMSFSGTEAFLFVVFSTLLGFVASFLCVREINNGWAAAERS